MSLSLIEISEKFKRADGLDEFWSVATDALQDFGVSNVLYGALGSPREVAEGRITRSLLLKHNYPRSYVDAYGADTLLDAEYSAYHCATSTDVLIWHDQSYCRDDSRFDLDRFERDRELGFHVGISIPMRGVMPGHVGGVGLSMPEIPEQDFLNFWKSSGQTIFAVCHLLDTSMRQTHMAEFVGLSSRERDVLSFLAAGVRVGQLGEKLGISNKTVEKYLPQARRKLKAVTNEQAVAKAMFFNLIQP